MYTYVEKTHASPHPHPSHTLAQIRVKDGRILVGDFICLDKQGNIILNHAIERYEENGKTEEKLLGQVLVPATQRETCDIETVTSDLEAIHAVLASPTAV